MVKLKPSRRRFLSYGAAATAGLVVGSSTGRARPAILGANDTLNLGVIGCGGRGRAVMRNHRRVEGVRVVAVCDVNTDRLALGVKDSGNPQVKTYRDFRELLDNKEIDAVISAPNGHWHALAAIYACQAGKDVYTEKPLATSIGEGRVIIEAARKYNRIAQIGTQQRNTTHYQKAAEIVRSGRLGEISEVKVWDYDNFYPGFGSPPDAAAPPEFGEKYWDLWVGPSPKAVYNPNRFIRHYWFMDYGGGWQLDWAVHHYDIVNLCMGDPVPVSATAMGGFFCFEETNTEWPDTFSSAVQFGPGPVAKKGFLLQYTFRGGCVNAHSYAESHGKTFFGAEASLTIDRSGYTITDEATGKGKVPKVVERVESVDNGEVAHAQAFVDAVRSRKRPSADVENGHVASIPGHLMNIAWTVGRTVKWDSKTESIPGDQEANALVKKTYRAPWKLEA